MSGVSEFSRDSSSMTAIEDHSGRFIFLRVGLSSCVAPMSVKKLELKCTILGDSPSFFLRNFVKRIAFPSRRVLLRATASSS
jgi:hypothetical protein